jgi:bacterioferritin
MGTKGRAIVGMNVDKLVEVLNRAYASEWLAYYQYWLGAKLIKGPMKDAVAAELTLHATEELGHAVLLADRIIQLGGTPVVHPRDWMSASPCAYDAPVDPLVSTLLDQNIAGEQCAIGVYKDLMDLTKDKDPVTWNLALTILQQEVEHEEDLQSLREDVDLLLRRALDPPTRQLAARLRRVPHRRRRRRLPVEPRAAGRCVTHHGDARRVGDDAVRPGARGPGPREHRADSAGGVEDDDATFLRSILRFDPDGRSSGKPKGPVQPIRVETRRTGP